MPIRHALPVAGKRFSVAVLIEDIESSRHRFTRAEKQRLIILAAKVAKVHGENHPEQA
jgi:iron-sulfur cluster repair protein YtfE (RIC family)